MKERAVTTTLLLGVFWASTAAAQFQAQGSTTGGFQTSAPPLYYTPRQLDNIGKDGQFIFAIERITGVFLDRQTLAYTQEGQTYEHTLKQTTYGLFGMNADSPSALPRFAVDYAIIGGLTVGANFMLSGRSFSRDGQGGQRPATVPSAGPDGFTILAGGRAGWAYAFDETFAVWPRAGISYASTSAEVDVINPEDGSGIGTFESETHFLDLSLELLAAVSPIEHIVLLGGPYLDVGLGGGYSVEVRGQEGDLDRRDAHLTSFGFAVHAGGYY